MLRHRLFSGTLMTIVFAGLVIFDSWLDGSLTNSAENKSIQATLFCILIAGLMIPAQMEFSRLARAKNLKIFTPVSIVASILFACTWYFQQFFKGSASTYLLLLSAFVMIGLFLYQHVRYGNSEVISNCGANYFSIMYLGGLSAFFPAIRIEFGPWPFLMFIFTVKSADIGAYTAGKLFGKHKFSPQISPGKTWEGLAGAAVLAAIVAVLFGAGFDIMAWWSAGIFGICFAFIGQLADLAESMIKRDAEQKDSANTVPGFGGILDVIDSVLVAAPLAYLFFMCCCR